MAGECITIKLAAGIGIAPFGERSVLPKAFSVVITEGDLPYDLVLDVRVADGTPECEAVKATKRSVGPAITGEGLRQLPIARLLRAAAVSAAQGVSYQTSGKALFEYQTPEEQRQWRADAIAAALHVGRKRRQLTPDHLRDVAEVWRSAPDTRQRTKWVAERFTTSRQNARKWLKAAREAGLIAAEEETP